jgi:glycosyltransferase involved in cell wall biosynthesis
MFPDLFIAFSQKGYEWAKSVNPIIRMIRVPHGVDLNKFSRQVKPVKLDLERPIFITAAHLVPYKRVGETVRAVAKLERGSLLVLGEGSLAKEIDELGNRLLGPKKYLRLVTSHNQVAKYLAAADVFTLVSEESEAFGLVYLEAMACNLPVVASDDSLRRELVGDHAAIRLSAESRRAGAGIFVKNPENTREYAKALERAAKIDWGDKPMKQARKFDLERITERYLQEFREINSLLIYLGGRCFIGK